MELFGQGREDGVVGALHFKEDFSRVVEFGLFLITLELLIDVPGHFCDVRVDLDVFVLVEATDDLVYVVDVVFELFLLKSHGGQLGFGVSVQHFQSLSNCVENVLGSFEDNPPFVDVFGT